MSSLDDQSLMARIQAGNEEAFEELASRLQARLFSFAYRYLRERESAKDAVQEAMLRVWRHRGEYREGARVSTWAFAIVLNLCRDQLRKQGRMDYLERPEVLVAAEASSHARKGPSPQDQAETAQLAGLLAEALDALPPLQSKVLKLRQQDKSYEETAQELGISQQAARAASSRGVKNLKDLMDKDR